MSRRHLDLGAAGEDRAAQWYIEQGYTVVARNWRCPEGELDLVLRKGSLLVFCEVKTRSSARFGQPSEAVNRDKQRRLRMLAALFLKVHRTGTTQRRFDVASVLPGRIDVITGAF